MVDKNAYKFKPNLKKRIYATLLDYGIYLLFFICYIEIFGHNGKEGLKEIGGVMALPLPLFWFIYFVIIEAVYGATLGHRFFKLKVLTFERTHISFVQALKRHILDCIDILFYGIPAIIAIKNSDKHQRLGDMLARTIVVDIKDKEQCPYFN